MLTFLMCVRASRELGQTGFGLFQIQHTCTKYLSGLTASSTTSNAKVPPHDFWILSIFS